MANSSPEKINHSLIKLEIIVFFIYKHLHSAYYVLDIF